MKSFVLQRQPSGPQSTIGRVTLQDQHVCFTCEDVVREVPGVPVSVWKVDGKTAIPHGTYQVIVTFSNRFSRLLPLLVNVPGFSGIRIHPGNTSADTEGCILPGVTTVDGSVFRSRDAFAVWYEQIVTALLAGDRVELEIRNA